MAQATFKCRTTINNTKQKVIFLNCLTQFPPYLIGCYLFELQINIEVDSSQSSPGTISGTGSIGDDCLQLNSNYRANNVLLFM